MLPALSLSARKIRSGTDHSASVDCFAGFWGEGVARVQIKMPAARQGIASQNKMGLRGKESLTPTRTQVKPMVIKARARIRIRAKYLGGLAEASKKRTPAQA